ncbi:hypothetical protein [Amycolatopsis azurea]|uniref:DUF559 domain-containing protein n=2 Tax=Amycolatopsis azurea TaxID=36819 RepID=A0ABX3JEW2_9PSEU|nr:hypothetical protein [Amycolatopsis azurea]OOC06265.1 hypothetical protein B0293_12250 [Amycolatopsis azurea DSM 43854]
MVNRGRWAQHPELLLERSRNGVIRVADLESEDMSSSTIYARCLPGGPWQRLLPGIVLLHNTEPRPEELISAALLYSGGKSMLTGVAACLQHGLRPAALPQGNDLHMLIPHERKVRSTGFVTMERTIRFPKPRAIKGVPTAPLVRATTDAVRRLRESGPVEEVLIEAVQSGRCSPQALLGELNSGTQRGTAIPRRLLSSWIDIRSMAESRARTLSRRLPTPPSHWNCKVLDHRGEYLGRPDAWWDDIALAWEIDSFDFHFRRADYSRTLNRNTRYTAAGILVVQTLPSRLRDDPAGVIGELIAAHEVASARPRPTVHVTDANAA